MQRKDNLTCSVYIAEISLQKMSQLLDRLCCTLSRELWTKFFVLDAVVVAWETLRSWVKTECEPVRSEREHLSRTLSKIGARRENYYSSALSGVLCTLLILKMHEFCYSFFPMRQILGVQLLVILKLHYRFQKTLKIYLISTCLVVQLSSQKKTHQDCVYFCQHIIFGLKICCFDRNWFN